MLATNFDIVKRLRARITERSLDRFMAIVAEASMVAAIALGAIALYLPGHRKGRDSRRGGRAAQGRVQGRRLRASG